MAFRKNIIEGWKEIPTGTISTDYFTIKAYAYNEATIDRNCDALNGWYAIETDYKIEIAYTNADADDVKYNIRSKDKNTISKVFNILDNIADSNDIETSFYALRNFIN